MLMGLELQALHTIEQQQDREVARTDRINARRQQLPAAITINDFVVI